MLALMLALAGTASAEDVMGLPPLPARPVRSTDEPGDCEAKAALLAGESLACDAVALPPAYLAYLEEARVYSEQLELRVAALDAIRAYDARACSDMAAWRTAEIEHLRTAPPTPFFERPGTMVAIGMVTGVVAVAVGGWSIGKVSP